MVQGPNDRLLEVATSYLGSTLLIYRTGNPVPQFDDQY